MYRLSALHDEETLALATASNHSTASPPLRWAAGRQRKPWSQLQAELVEENDWKNGMVTWTLPGPLRVAMPRIAQAWYRCYVMCMGM
jgi:hypothetical protein